MMWGPEGLLRAYDTSCSDLCTRHQHVEAPGTTDAKPKNRGARRKWKCFRSLGVS